MKIHTASFLLWCLTWLVIGALPLSAAEIWVSPNGSDANPGTREQPLASPELALRKGRELRRLKDASIAGGVKVVLRGGEYVLSEPLRVFPEDSGTAESPTALVAAPGEQPVLSGGVTIKGWQQVDQAVPGLPAVAVGKIWRAEIPFFNGRRLEFRQLWIDGHKAVRARTPGEGTMARLMDWDRTKRTASIPANLNLPAKLDGVEMVVLQMWEIAVLRLKTYHIDGDKAWVTFHEPESRVEFEHPWPQPSMSPKYGNAPFFLANAIEFLDESGEWFADQASGWIYYWPRSGEDLVHVQVVAPALETLVEVAGTLDRPVKQVTVSGLHFNYTTWLRPTLLGHVPLQAGFYLLEGYGLKPKGTPDWRSLDNQAWLGRPPAAVTVGGAQQISFTRCSFAHIAATALDLRPGTSAGKVEGCGFRDVGMNGIMTGAFAEGGFESHLPYAPADEREICSGIKITNNLVIDCANEDWGGVAILAGFVRNAVIEHNEINGTSYTGISVGWGWTRTANAMRNNRIHSNHIQHVATRMSDTAGIYTLSAQPGTVVSENVVQDITMSPYVHDPEHWFYLYTDEGSSSLTVRDNWCLEERFLQNANGPGNTWLNNGPQVDAKIKAAAGLEAAFRDLLKP